MTDATVTNADAAAVSEWVAPPPWTADAPGVTDGALAEEHLAGCPSCGSEQFNLRAEFRHISCAGCGLAFRVEEYFDIDGDAVRNCSVSAAGNGKRKGKRRG